MTKLEIVAQEQLNEGVLNLYEEGAFYKAYQQSAFILCTNTDFPFKVSVKPLKGLNGPLLSVGFPVSSLEKWTVGGELEVVSAKCLRVHYSFPVDLSGYESWYLSCAEANSVSACAASRCPRLSDKYFPVYGLAYRMTKEVTDLCSRLKRNYRYSLGEDLRQNMMKATIAITFASKKGLLEAKASEAMMCVESAELCLRLLNELGELSDERYIPFIDIVEGIKNQLEKWARSGHTS